MPHPSPTTGSTPATPPAEGREGPPPHALSAASLAAPARFTEAGVPQLVLGLRLLALAVVSGSGALLPASSARLPQLGAGVIAGVAVGVAQYLALRARRPRIGESLIFAQVAAWTWLVQVSGDMHSPLFVGYLLEVALSGAAFARRGCVLAALASFGAYLLSTLRYGPFQPGALAIVGGFLAIASVLTWLMIDVIERQRRKLHLYHDALRARAETVAEQLRLLGDYLGGALVGLDGLGRVVSANRACGPLLGIEPASAVGRPWQEVVAADAGGRGAIAAALCDATPRRGVHMTLRRGDGRTTAVEAELWVSPSPEGRRTYLLMGEMPVAAASADPLHRLGEAAAIVAHQIKNSLHAVQCLASELARERGSAAEREDADRMCQVVRGLATLSDDVLAMAGAARPPQEDVPLADVLASATLLAHRAAGRVLVEKSDPELRVRAHRGQLVHAFFNLIDNACHVTPCGERVRVSTSRCAERVMVEIADGGPGFPPELANGAAPLPSRHGSGFGLLAARRFLEANGGALSYHPGVPAGAVCRVVLPAAPACREGRG